MNEATTISASEKLSWRDPDGFVVRFDGRILRAVALKEAAHLREVIGAPWLQRLIVERCVPETAELQNPPRLTEDSDQWIWLEHQPLEFPAYPHEITALQLYDSARITLKVALAAAEGGWVLKDASAWNVLHSRGRAVFVDLLSFEKAGRSGVWVAYGQFVRHFILPLMLHRHLQMTPVELFLTNRDGVTPERAYQLLGRTNLMSAAGLEFVLFPKWLERAGARLIKSQSEGRGRAERPMSTNLLVRTLSRLQRTLETLCPDLAAAKSIWKGYEEERTHYSEADLVLKRDFVRVHLGDSDRVLDLGCNAGEFSMLAAKSAGMVVATDFDHPALSRLYQRVREQNAAITPMALNIGRPTPAIGWLNLEIPSFLQRATGQFDCILVLGLVHHLLVGERVSLAMLADFFHRLDPRRLIIEWVDPTDPKFRQLTGLNAALYRELDFKAFESSLAQHFRLTAKLPLSSGTRIVYLWER